MKNILTIIGFVFVVLLLLSYKPADNSKSYSTTLSIPLRQKAVLVTRDYDKVCRLIKSGWVVQDVDITGEEYRGRGSSYSNGVEKYYTIIKY